MKAFAAFWKDKGYEKGESQTFWMSLLRDVYGIEHPEQFISFEDQVKLDHTSFIDGYIDATHVMIEQKGLGKDLRKGIKQSDGSILSPFQQAKRYAAELPYSKRPRWIITCNFAEFLVYDMEKPNGEPEQILLKDLPKEYYRLQFLVDTGNENLKKEMEISLKAGDLVGKLYDAILKQYKNPDDLETLKSLNKLCVRLVFCLYAEDAGIFGKHQVFHDYLKKYPASEVHHKLVELFRILDTKEEDRDPYLDEDLLAFPYVNGGLFADEHIEIPRFTDEIVNLLLTNASEDFDWSGISPTIFGAVFESTLNTETRCSGGMHYQSRLPATEKSYANIVEGNALRIDWESVVDKSKLSYIMGNPPFVGYSLQSKEQKNDMLSIYVDEKGKPYKTAGKIDYVSAWYFKAAQLMVGTEIRTAFVSTNSITQGEQVAGVWKPLYDRFGVHIDFAHRTFRWDSEASLKAHVHCVIVGFSIAENKADRRLFDNDSGKIVKNINPFLVEAPNVFIESRSTPICDVPKMTTGNRPADGGHLIIEAEDYADFIKREPNAVKYIKRLMGAKEYINSQDRYCLWLVDASPAELRKMPLVMERVEACKQDRLNGTEDRQKLAETPTLFRELKNPSTYIIVPRHSSETRRYIPMGFLDSNFIPTDSATIIPEATLFHFGILMSNVHMAWTRTVCGRIKSDYCYSKDVVYNNFPWCEPTPEQKARIEQTAQMILDARAKYPDCSLADLYDETVMPPELCKAHQLNDRAVMEAYGFWGRLNTESECVAELMGMYQKLTEGK